MARPRSLTGALGLLLAALSQVQCGTPCSSTPYVARVDGSVTVTAEFQYFEDGLCTGFCRRLRDCNVLCQSLALPPATCDNNGAEAFDQCMHGLIRTDLFGIPQCPHACPANRFAGAAPCDANRCGADVYGRSCQRSGPGSIGDVFRAGSVPCTEVCQ